MIILKPPREDDGDVMLDFLQLQLVEVRRVTKTEPRCISEVRKLYTTITDAKHRKPSRPETTSWVDASNAYGLWMCTEEMYSPDLNYIDG